MRHHNKNKKFGRTRNQRKALLRSLAASFFKHGKIKTTSARARAVRPFVEKLITQGKKEGIKTSRLIRSRLGGNTALSGRFVKESASRHASRKGGYTRITKLPRRASDGSKMAIIELV